MAKIKILVVGDGVDTTPVAAYLNLMVRKLGLVPAVQSPDMARLMAVSADDWTLGRTVQCDLTDVEVVIVDGGDCPQPERAG